MQVSLRPELERFLDQQVEQGRFDSIADAIHAAVARLQAEAALADDVDELRAEIQVGVDEADRGEFVEYTAEDVIRERRAARARDPRQGA